MTDAISQEIYPNSPLVEVVFEVRFRGDMAVQCHLDRFWDAVRSEYPVIHVPTVGAKPQPAPYRWEDETGTCGIMVGINRLSYFARVYPGFAKFSDEFSRTHALFKKCFPAVDVSTRRGWRYINLIPFARASDGEIPVEFYLERQPAELAARSGRVIQLDTKSVSIDGELRKFLHIQSVRNDKDGTDAIRIDIDCAFEIEGGFSEALADMSVLHRRAREMFECLITDEYRKYLRGNHK